MTTENRADRDTALPLNLLFIFTDEQRLDTLECYGNSAIEMPHLNAFSSKACVFESPYCAAPVCTPSRGTIMTGLYPHQHGATMNNVPLDSQARCLPEILAAQSEVQYATGYIGKWHLGDEVFKQHGFDEWVSIEDMYHPFYSGLRDSSVRDSSVRDADRKSDYHTYLLDRGLEPQSDGFFGRRFCARLPEELGKPAFIASEARRFLGAHRDEPFALYINFLEPHMPFTGPRDGQYDPSAVALPPNFGTPPDGSTPRFLHELCKRFEREGFGGDRLANAEDWRALISKYWGLNSLIDTHVGAILETLSDLGLDERTIVVFTSDHGDMMGSHNLLTKGVMYREATQVPLLLRLPGQERRGTIRGPVSHIDLLPSLLELMGQPIPEELAGLSLSGLIRMASTGSEVDAEGAASPCVVSWHRGEDGDRGRGMPEARSMITSRHRASFYESGEVELYDLDRDPLELANLGSEGSSARVLSELHSALREWQDSVGDGFALPG